MRGLFSKREIDDGITVGWERNGRLGGRQLEERLLAVLDGRDSASWVYGGVAGRETAE